MFNIFEFTKGISNAGKLDRDLRAHVTLGSLYDYVTIKGDLIKVYFKVNLNQEQTDELSSVVNNFNNVSVQENLHNYLDSSVTPFIRDLIGEFSAENIAMGITQAGKTNELLGVFEKKYPIGNVDKPISLKASFDTGSLYASRDIIQHLRNNPSEFSDLSPFVTDARLLLMKNEIESFLGIALST